MAAYEEPHKFLAIKKSYDKEKLSQEDFLTQKENYAQGETLSQGESLTQRATKRRITYTYDRAGRLIKKEDGNAVTTYTYDEDHNILCINLPEGGTIRYVYDEANRPVCHLEQDKQHGISRLNVYHYNATCPLTMEDLYPKENQVKKQNALLLDCNSFVDYSEEKLQSICKEKPEKEMYYQGKKALSLYKNFEDIYNNYKVTMAEAKKSYLTVKKEKINLKRHTSMTLGEIL